jgi:hypothetical protein
MQTLIKYYVDMNIYEPSKYYVDVYVISCFYKIYLMKFSYQDDDVDDDIAVVCITKNNIKYCTF